MSKKPVDKRGVLDDTVFTYRITKSKRVFISWHGKTLTILAGRQAEDFMLSIAGAEGKQAQLIMAKATGHFKHGNEKPPPHSKK